MFYFVDTVNAVLMGCKLHNDLISRFLCFYFCELSVIKLILHMYHDGLIFEDFND